MHCSGCGKDIPFAGAVCPYCHRDKSRDQRYTVLAAVIGTVGAVIGWKIGGFWGAVGGFLGGAVLAAIATGMGKPNMQAPEVQLAAQGVQSGVVGAVDERLRKLQQLQDQGLISVDEAAAKRQQILSEV